MSQTTELISLYREAAKNTADPSVRKRNQSAKRLNGYYKQLRATLEGQAALLTLLSDPDRNVRCWVASHTILFAPAQARPVLESLRDTPGICSLEAEIVLREYDAGRLTFD